MTLRVRPMLTVTSHEHHGVSNHRQLDCLFDTFFRRTPKKQTNWSFLSHRLTVDFPHIRPIMRKVFPCHDIIMVVNTSSVLMIPSFASHANHYGVPNGCDMWCTYRVNPIIVSYHQHPRYAPDPFDQKSCHYNNVIMGVIASQNTSLTSVFSSVYLDTDQRKHQSSASPETGEFPAQMASNAENVSISWRHHGVCRAPRWFEMFAFYMYIRS